MDAMSATQHVHQVCCVKLVAHKLPLCGTALQQLRFKFGFFLCRVKSKNESELKSEIAVPKELDKDVLKKQAWHTIEINGKNWSSMVQDMRSNRGATEIDFINGTIVRWAHELGLQAPINAELVRLVKQKTEAQKVMARVNVQ